MPKRVVESKKKNKIELCCKTSKETVHQVDAISSLIWHQVDAMLMLIMLLENERMHFRKQKPKQKLAVLLNFQGDRASSRCHIIAHIIDVKNVFYFFLLFPRFLRFLTFLFLPKFFIMKNVGKIKTQIFWNELQRAN